MATAFRLFRNSLQEQTVVSKGTTIETEIASRNSADRPGAMTATRAMDRELLIIDPGAILLDESIPPSRGLVFFSITPYTLKLTAKKTTP